MMIETKNVNKITLVAVILVSGKTPSELQEMYRQLTDSKDSRSQFIERIKVTLADTNVEFTMHEFHSFCEAIAQRVQSNIELKLGIPEMV